MLNKNQKSRVLDELAFIMFSGNLRPVETEDQSDEIAQDDDGTETESEPTPTPED